MTASLYSPSYVHESDHAFHQLSVVCSANQGSIGRGHMSWDRYQVKMNGICWPAFNVRSATVFRSSPRVSALVHRPTESGPAVADSSPSWVVTQGSTDP